MLFTALPKFQMLSWLLSTRLHSKYCVAADRLNTLFFDEGIIVSNDEKTKKHLQVIWDLDLAVHYVIDRDGLQVKEGASTKRLLPTT